MSLNRPSDDNNQRDSTLEDVEQRLQLASPIRPGLRTNELLAKACVVPKQLNGHKTGFRRAGLFAAIWTSGVIVGAFVAVLVTRTASEPPAQSVAEKRESPTTTGRIPQTSEGSPNRMVANPGPSDAHDDDPRRTTRPDGPSHFVTFGDVERQVSGTATRQPTRAGMLIGLPRVAQPSWSPQQSAEVPSDPRSDLPMTQPITQRQLLNDTLDGIPSNVL